MFQGGVWLLVGLTSLVYVVVVVFFGWFVNYFYSYHRKCLNDESLDKRVVSGRRSQGR